MTAVPPKEEAGVVKLNHTSSSLPVPLPDACEEADAPSVPSDCTTKPEFAEREIFVAEAQSSLTGGVGVYAQIPKEVMRDTLSSE